jgi:hypothetical protein
VAHACAVRGTFSSCTGKPHLSWCCSWYESKTNWFHCHSTPDCHIGVQTCIARWPLHYSYSYVLVDVSACEFDHNHFPPGSCTTGEQIRRRHCPDLAFRHRRDGVSCIVSEIRSTNTTFRCVSKAGTLRNSLSPQIEDLHIAPFQGPYNVQWLQAERFCPTQFSLSEARDWPDFSTAAVSVCLGCFLKPVGYLVL